uniref:Uncharacterized protein n=1 Tax=Romanomermis culicivorax TaxID=13658 RepID=A0A915JP40_ROMCU
MENQSIVDLPTRAQITKSGLNVVQEHQHKFMIPSFVAYCVAENCKNGKYGLSYSIRSCNKKHNKFITLGMAHKRERLITANEPISAYGP